MNHRFSIFWLVLVLLAVGCDCGGDDDDDNDDAAGDDDAGDDDAGDDDAGDDDAGDDDAGDDDADCGSGDMLPGEWVSNVVNWTINADLSYHAVGVLDTSYDVTGEMTVAGCTLTMVDLAGTGACPANQLGVYDFVVTDTTLTTTVVDDPCIGRVLGINNKTFTR